MVINVCRAIATIIRMHFVSGVADVSVDGGFAAFGDVELGHGDYLVHGVGAAGEDFAVLAVAGILLSTNT